MRPGESVAPKISWLSNAPDSEIKERIVLVRADLNVPVLGGVVQSEDRIIRTIPTLRKINEMGGFVILVSHMESEGENPSMELVCRILDKYVPCEFFGGELSQVRNQRKSLERTKILVLDNLRKNPGEKKNDDSFAKELASVADVYVNDAFSVSHRSHASVVGVTKYLESYGGLSFEREIRELSLLFEPERPCVVVQGGAKSGSKIPVLKHLAKKADKIFVFGAIANTFAVASGYDVGVSPYDVDQIENAKLLLKEAEIVLPADIETERLGERKIKTWSEIGKDELVVDAGPKSLLACLESIQNAKTILWNGPTGIYEKGYKHGTEVLAEGMANVTGHTIVGGGDTVANLPEDVQGRFKFISGGGGAMLDYLATGTLPGIEALKQKGL